MAATEVHHRSQPWGHCERLQRCPPIAVVRRREVFGQASVAEAHRVSAVGIFDIEKPQHMRCRQPPGEKEDGQTIVRLCEVLYGKGGKGGGEGLIPILNSTRPS